MAINPVHYDMYIVRLVSSVKMIGVKIDSMMLLVNYSCYVKRNWSPWSKKLKLYGHRKYSSIFYMCWYQLINSLQCLKEMALGLVIFKCSTR